MLAPCRHNEPDILPGTALLARATAVLERVGVWRILTDMAEVNEPIWAAFRSEGSTEGPTGEAPTKSQPDD